MSNDVAKLERWPAGTSEDYIEARQKLAEEEYKLSQEVERVAAMRRKLPPGAILKDYTFEESTVGTSLPGPKVSLDSLVRSNRSLLVYHLMFGADSDEACSMCSLFVDGFNGVAQHIGQNFDLVLVGKAPAAKLQAWAAKRGWDGLRIFSSLDSSFNHDMNFEHANWAPQRDQVPGISVFRKEGEGDGAKVRHLYSSSAHFTPSVVRGIDLLSPYWGLADLVPEGRGAWIPSNDYIVPANNATVQ